MSLGLKQEASGVIIVALGPESPAFCLPLCQQREDFSGPIRFFLLGASCVAVGEANLLRDTLAPQYCRKSTSVTLLRAGG